MADENNVEILVTLKDLATEQLRQLKAALGDVEEAVDGAGKKAKSAEVSLGGLVKTLGGLKQVVAGSTVVAMGYAFKEFTGSVMEAGAEVEHYIMRLRFLTGSLEKAEVAYRKAASGAEKLGLTDDEAVAAVINLTAAMKGNVELAQKMLPLAANLAAATSQSIEHVTTMLGRTMLTGQVMARGFQDKLLFSMIGLAQGVKYSAAEIQLALETALVNPKLQGAALEMSKTWDVTMKLMGHVWEEFLKDIAAAGTFEFVKGTFRDLLNLINDTKGATEGYSNLTQEVSILIIGNVQGVMYAFAGLIDTINAARWAVASLAASWALLEVKMNKGKSVAASATSSIMDWMSVAAELYGGRLADAGADNVGAALKGMADNYKAVSETLDDSQVKLRQNVTESEKAAQAAIDLAYSKSQEANAIDGVTASIEKQNAAARSRAAKNPKGGVDSAPMEPAFVAPAMKPAEASAAAATLGAAQTKMDMHNLEVQHKAGLVSLQEYNDKRIELIKAQGKREVTAKLAIWRALQADEAAATKANDPKAEQLIKQRIDAEAAYISAIASAGEENVKLAEDIENKRNEIAIKGAEFRANLEKNRLQLNLAAAVTEPQKIAVQKAIDDQVALDSDQKLKNDLYAQAAEAGMSQEELQQRLLAIDQQRRAAQAGEEKTAKDKKAAEDFALQMQAAATAAQTFDSMAEVAAGFYELSGQKSREAFVAMKTMQIASTLIATYAAAMTAYKNGLEQGGTTYGSTLGTVYAAVAMAQGLMRVAMIRAQTYAVGGVVGGVSSSPTADNIPAMLTAGEFVQPVSTVQHYGRGVMEAMRQQAIPREAFSSYRAPSAMPHARYAYATGGPVMPTSSSFKQQQQSTTIVNVTDPQMLEQYVQTRPGEKSVMNVITKNRMAVRQLMSE